MPRIGPLTRDQLAEFLPNHEAIKAFERMMQAVFEFSPGEIEEINRNIQDVAVTGSQSFAAATQANDEIGRALSMIDIINAQLSGGESSIGYVQPQSMPIDYIDFDRSSAASHRVGRVAWSYAADTLDIQHSGGVTQQVGAEVYVYGINKTGVTLTDGMFVAVDGVDPASNLPMIYPFLADGVENTSKTIGLLTQTLNDGDRGRVVTLGIVRGLDTTGTPYGETWLVGDVVYCSWTVAGQLTNINPYPPATTVSGGLVIKVDATDGAIYTRTSGFPSARYAVLSIGVTQTIAAANTAYAAVFTANNASSGIGLGTPASRIVFAESGLCTLNVTLQIDSNNASAKKFWIWFRKNGVDIANSSVTHTIADSQDVATLTRVFPVIIAPNDYVEVMYAANNTGVTIPATAATAFAPAAPALSCVVSQIVR